MTVQELDEREIQTVSRQMTCEIFRLAGRNPTDHASCFHACVQMVNDTDVIQGTNFKEWEKHSYVQVGLDNLQSAQGPDDRYDPEDPDSPGTVWMMNAPVAVAAAAALNLPRIRIQKDSRLICAFNKSELWGWIGGAIDFWSSLSGPIVSTLPRGAIVHLLHVAETIDDSDQVSLLSTHCSPLHCHYSSICASHKRKSRLRESIGSRSGRSRRSMSLVGKRPCRKGTRGCWRSLGVNTMTKPPLQSQ